MLVRRDTPPISVVEVEGFKEIFRYFMPSRTSEKHFMKKKDEPNVVSLVSARHTTLIKKKTLRAGAH